MNTMTSNYSRDSHFKFPSYLKLSPSNLSSIIITINNQISRSESNQFYQNSFITLKDLAKEYNSTPSQSNMNKINKFKERFFSHSNNPQKTKQKPNIKYFN